MRRHSWRLMDILPKTVVLFLRQIWQNHVSYVTGWSWVEVTVRWLLSDCLTVPYLFFVCSVAKSQRSHRDGRWTTDWSLWLWLTMEMQTCRSLPAQRTNICLLSELTASPWKPFDISANAETRSNAKEEPQRSRLTTFISSLVFPVCF